MKVVGGIGSTNVKHDLSGYDLFASFESKVIGVHYAILWFVMEGENLQQVVLILDFFRSSTTVSIIFKYFRNFDNFISSML